MKNSNTMTYLNNLISILLLSFLCTLTQAQQVNDINLNDSIPSNGIHYATKTFESTRVLNGHSNELMPEGQLDFRIEHRFGLINQGSYEFYGLDQALIKFALEYGIKDWAMVGINRCVIDKMVSGFAKFSLLKQSSGTKIIPVSATVLLETSIIGTKWDNPDQKNAFSSRVSYVGQLILARKFNEHLSLMLAPVWIHRNLVPTTTDNKDMFALGVASRYKIFSMASLNAEYYPVLSQSWDHQNTSFRNALSFGFEIETDGHIFQLMVTNSVGMNEKSFITETMGNKWKDDLHLGLNISRSFSLK